MLLAVVARDLPVLIQNGEIAVASESTVYHTFNLILTKTLDTAGVEVPKPTLVPLLFTKTNNRD
jgi:hypothetical protein